MPAQIFVAPIENGVCVQIVGKGTMHESSVIRDIILNVLNATPPANVIMDLSRCDYLDSTLLGCLIAIHRVAGKRWRVVAPDEVVKKVLAPTRLDTMLPVSSEPAALTGTPVLLDIKPTRLSDLTEHLYECHARLAEIEGPLQPFFTRIAAQLKHDLTARKTT